MFRFLVHRSRTHDVSQFRGRIPHFLCQCTGSTLMPGQSWVQTVLASGTSSRPEVGSSAVAPPMDVEDCPLLETGLPGCPYRFAEYSGQPFSDGNPAFGLQLHHPRFLEFVGAPESARLLCRSRTSWVDQLGREQAMAAAVNLQWDAGIMLSNLQVLSQFATSLHHISSELMVLGIGWMVFPQAEVADLSPAPQAARAAKYMSAMGLWRPPTGPGVPGPVPALSCRSCMTCEYCFPEDKLPPGWCVFCFSQSDGKSLAPGRGCQFFFLFFFIIFGHAFQNIYCSMMQ